MTGNVSSLFFLDLTVFIFNGLETLLIIKLGNCNLFCLLTFKIGEGVRVRLLSIFTVIGGKLDVLSEV